jgi:hypothetical protein
LQQGSSSLPAESSEIVVVVLVQLIDDSLRFRIEFAWNVFEFGSSAVAPKASLRKEFHQIMFTVARDTTGITEPGFL